MFLIQIENTYLSKLLLEVCSEDKLFGLISIPLGNPKKLLEKAKQSWTTEIFFIPGNTTFQLSQSLWFDLAKLKCNDYYWLFLNINVSSAAGPRKWERVLQ